MDAISVEPVLRVAVADDAGVIAAIYNESVAVGDASMDDDPKRAEDVRRTLAGFGERELVLLLVVPPGSGGDEEVLGWGMLKRYSDRNGYRFAAETTVYLRRSQTGRGYGARLGEALIERAQRHGYHHLVAKILADNEASMGLHRKLGYELVGVQRAIGYRDGRWRDVAILALVLD